MSEKGVNDPGFKKSGLAINPNVYTDKCCPVHKRFKDNNHKNKKSNT